MDIVKITVLSLFTLIVIILTKKFNSDAAQFISCITGISITVFSIGILFPVFDYINELGKSESFSGFTGIMFKSTGVCLLCGCAGEICRDCGEGSLASKIDLAGKCTLLTFALPLIKTVFEYAKTFIS